MALVYNYLKSLIISFFVEFWHSKSCWDCDCCLFGRHVRPNKDYAHPVLESKAATTKLFLKCGLLKKGVSGLEPNSNCCFS